ncbi:DUF1217 domain-containing protein [Tropicimonas isoalkanivorans]|uniref:Flagellar protein n=1 Tax=Tropicimonas isoalkanivorans TaxID=441112 RepID=A0A1I1RU98_9RHOB|nr:DUF1217 domain-containing protein [Tropicimonas isoalkanivorans]SFD35103.1 Protein of unknown function [Tropicimonas isoalkanivorans]
MSFQPILPLSGYSGWAFLNRTLESQKENFAASRQVQSDVDYFRENISNVRSATDLVGDYRLLKVALGAFGLDDDIGNKFFVQKVLSEGTSSGESFSNKLADKRYFAFSQAFGLGDGEVTRTALPGFSDSCISAYQERQFEMAVGEQNENFRLALDTRRELAEIASGDLSENGMWYSVMGSPPLRTVFETAFNLPSSFSSLNIDDQLEVFRDKASREFGEDSIRQFSEPEQREKLIRTFLLRKDLNESLGAMTSNNIALMIISSANNYR